MSRATCDFLVVGGGVMGLTLALDLARRHRGEKIQLLEKEAEVGLHASGRNSGVLHAGFYYTADSLKARFCRAGNLRMHEYCDANGIAINRCGKLVVARNAGELASLDELKRRGDANGVPLELIDERAARSIEPRVRTFERALWSPTTSTIDPRPVMAALRDDAARAGIDVRTGVAYLGRRGRDVVSSAGPISTGYLVNAAGLYADRIARDFGFARRYQILPFKGLYLYSDEPTGSLRTNVYPVPDLRNPFLGVHFTVTADGHAKIGPTAIPCLWREQYELFSNFDAGEAAQVAGASLGLLLRAGFDFRGLAREEIRKYDRRYLIAQAAELLEGMRPDQWTRWGRPGIRAQLLDVEQRTLVMDFHTEGDDASYHVLNAVSPGWTCSFPFAEHVGDLIDQRLHRGTPSNGATGGAEVRSAAVAAGA